MTLRRKILRSVRNKEMNVDIITQTDFAAAIEASYHCPGAARVAGLVNRIREQNPTGTLFLDAGDVLCGAPIANLTDGAPVIDLLGRMGVDAMTLGNHEFDHGRETMERVLGRAAFPILCANILDEATQRVLPFAAPYVLLARAGLKIGVIGVTTAYTPYMVRADRFTGYTVLPPAQALQTWAPVVREKGADIVIALTHLPGTAAPDGRCTGELFDTAGAAPGVDVMIGGHNAGSIACVRGETVFAKAGFSAGQLAHIRLRLDENRRIVARDVQIYDMMECAKELPPPDGAIQRAVDAVMAPYRPALNEPLAHLSKCLRVDRNGECALGNFYTDGLREAAGAPVGLFNTTSIFGFMPAGTVTAEMVTHVMCFDEEIYAGDMTGEQLYRLFERTYEREHWKNNWSLQFSGVRAVVDTRRPEGERVVSLRLEDGTPIWRRTRVRVATTDYIAMGGNDYRDITSLTDWENTHVRTHAFFVDFLRRRGAIPEATDGRMLNLDPAWPDDKRA